jgi:steroid delta-isomerase-like uncharacterized protein
LTTPSRWEEDRIGVGLEENKAMVREALHTLWNEKDWDAEERYAAPDLVVHAPHTPEPFHGAEGFKELGQIVQGSFPDYHLEITDLIAEREYVVARFTWTGTQTGELQGLPATGKPVTMDEVNVYRFNDEGRVAEIWAHQNMMSMMTQLGLIPDGPPPKLLLLVMKAGQRLKKKRGRNGKATTPG